MTKPALKRENKTFTQIESVITPVGEDIILDSIDANRTHCFCGLQFFSDAEGEISVVPTSGETLILIQTVNSYPAWEAVPKNIIKAQNPVTIDWAANTRTIQASSHIPIVGADFYKLIVTCNGT
ncbi:hypothetical protein KAR91_64120 [Candidatus Pacearchaeota archaeon]|nr:hypothetical protein [Candidatus Pacearchaeota archaeon]